MVMQNLAQRPTGRAFQQSKSTVEQNGDLIVKRRVTSTLPGLCTSGNPELAIDEQTLMHAVWRITCGPGWMAHLTRLQSTEEVTEASSRDHSTIRDRPPDMSQSIHRSVDAHQFTQR